MNTATPHPADDQLNWFVQVCWHPYASCYVYYDSPLFNEFGEIVGHHRANTIYLNPLADHPGEDLLHEVGHAVARHFDLVGHRDNHYCSHWEQGEQRLIGAVTHGRHWSRYLNGFAAAIDAFQSNAASELWAELYMLHHLYPDLPESNLINPALEKLRLDARYQRLEQAITELRFCWQLPGKSTSPRYYPGG